MKRFRLLPILFLLVTAALAANAQTLPYQDPSLSPEKRAEDLCSRLTLKEKVSLMTNGTPAIPRLGIGKFEWWSEALHGIGRNGVATVFPSPIGMACSFDNPLVEEVFSAVSDEGRAKYNIAKQDGNVFRYRGLSFWTPNINIFRDPRWGRGQETYGEDPFMTGQMGNAVVRGLQGGEGHKYYKLLACAKHFAVHSGPEQLRHNMDVNYLPKRDLYETYLSAFKELVQKGNVREIMCAYQRFDGHPCCGSNQLLTQILRDKWGFDGIVVSDCGAIDDFWRKGYHEYSPNAASASASAVLSGTDVECGASYRNLPLAVERGEISEADIDVSIKRLLKARFELGDFDDDSLVEWASIPASVIGSEGHKKLAHKMAQEQTVLLKNNGILPLAKDPSKIIVMGPNANDSTMLWGIYYGHPTHTVTLLEGINNKIGDVSFAQGCGLTDMNESFSIYNKFVTPEGKKGLQATYWNNDNFRGEPIAIKNYSEPIRLDNRGKIPFEPGIDLEHFSTTLKGSFKADRNETVNLILNAYNGRVIINGDTIFDRCWIDEFNFNSFPIEVKKGKTYDVQIDFRQTGGHTSLNIDLERVIPMTSEKILAKTKDKDVVIFIGGISPNLEREEARVKVPGFAGGDRTSIELPAVQREILRKLHEAGKKIVFVNCSGSAIALTPENEVCDAILQAWYPGEQGGNAIADILFGDYNPSGKLCVTFYKDDSQLPPFEEYRMNDRTYRFFEDQPLYPFGYGLSYTTFTYGTPKYKNGKVTVNVANTGNTDGDEIVQVYLRRPSDPKGPKKTLRGYTRVSLKKGENKNVEIDLPIERFEWWDEASGEMKPVPGQYEILVGPSSAETKTISVTI